MKPDTFYALDGAMELGELSPLEYAMARHDAPLQAEIDAWAASGRDHGPDYLANLCRNALERAAADFRIALALDVAAQVPAMAEQFHGRVNVVVRNKVLRDLGEAEDAAFPLIAEDTASPCEPVLFVSFSDVLPEKVREVVRLRFIAAQARWGADLQLIDTALAWADAAPVGGRREMARLALSRRASLADFGDMAAQVTGRKSPRGAGGRRQKAERRSARGAIKKALKLFERTEQLEAVTALVSGKEVTIAHADSAFKFILVPFAPGWLQRHTLQANGTAPFTIRLFTKTDVHLANLCVFFRDTPVLDQMLALMLYIQSGEESEVLKTANWFGVADAESVARELSCAGADGLLPKLAGRFSDSGAEGLDGGVELPPAMRKWEPYRGPVNQWLANILVAPELRHLVCDATAGVPALA